MSCHVYYENQLLTNCECKDNISILKNNISNESGVPFEDLYATVNGKIVPDNYELKDCHNVIRIQCRLLGGKGGFGSMLRAIGAQIEKTTNREACRDLSGRRLRDINEEKRLRKWLDGQADREKEALEKKQKKIERLLAEPKIDVTLNPSYEKERQDLPERVSAAVDAGWQAASSSNSSGTKRKAEEVVMKKKKSKLWIDAELSDCSSVSDSDDDDGINKASPGPAVSTDSGNESDKTCESNNKMSISTD